MNEFVDKIICGDALEELKKLPDESVDMCITSPPYFGLRIYISKDHPDYKYQLGLEPDFKTYLDKMLLITAEIKRVLKKTGSFWLNMGDCYGGSPTGSMPNPNSSFRSLRTQKAQMQAQEARKIIPSTDSDRMYKNATGRLKQPIISKCMLMMPERLALAMIDSQGWLLRNKIKWVKQIYIHKQHRTIGSVMPTSVKDRFNESGEELYFFVKNKKYYADLDSVRLNIQTFEDRPMGIDREKGYPESKRNRFDYKPFYEQNKFNYRVRDAEKKKGQCPQFKASEEEIKNYGLKKQDNVPSRNAALYKGFNKRWKEKNKVNDPRGNHEGGPGSWRDFKDENDSFTYPLGKNLPSCWLIGTEPHNFSRELKVDTDHFATFPQALVEIPIKFSYPKNGIILDPFCGSGTTCIVAKKLGRKYIGIDLNPDYCKMATQRINEILI